MPQEAIEIPVDIDLTALDKGLQSMVNLFSGSLKAAETHSKKFELQLSEITNSLNAINGLDNSGLQRVFVGGANGLRVLDAEASRERLTEMVDRLTGKWAVQQDAIERTVNSVAFLNNTMTRDAASKAIDKMSGRFRRFKTDVRSTRIEYDRLASTVASVTVRTPDRPQSSPNQVSTIGAVVQAGAAGAQVRAMAKINTGLKSVQRTVRSTRATFDSFRIAKLAPPVNEEMNIVKNGVKAVGDVTAGAIDKVRQAADASLDGWRDTATETARSANKVSAAMDDAALTTTKYTWKSKAAAGSLKLLKTVFFPLRETIGQFSSKADEAAKTVKKVDDATQSAAASAGHAAAKTAAFGWVLTGTFEEGSTTVATLAPAMKAAFLPSRLLFREFEGGRRIVTAATTVIAAVTSPMAKLRTSVEISKAQWGTLRKELSGASLGHKVISSAALATYQSLKTLTPILSVAKVGYRGLAGGVRLASTAIRAGISPLIGWSRNARGAGDEAGKSVNPIKRMGQAITSVGRKSTGGFGGMLKGMVSSRLAMSALLAGTVAWGGTTAVATETATVKFGTLLRDMDQGRALISDITKFSAATPFSNAALRESAGLLLNAQVPADQITAKLTKLGDIAAGTGKPIKDFALIFSKVTNTGKFGLEQINQLAERGVPIYGALQQTLGVTKGELKSMISSGKLGAAELEGAIDNLTTGTGVFAGGMAAQSQTAAGLFSTLKDNIGIALETLVNGFLGGAKLMMTSAITTVQTITGYLKKLQPVGEAMFGAISAAAGALWQGVQAIFSGLASLAASVFGDLGSSGVSVFDTIMRSLVIFYTTVEFTFNNIPTIAQIAFLTIQGAFHSLVGTLGHFFGTTLPAWFSWFGDNWSLIFLDAAALVGTAFSNIGKNIMNAMTAIWDFIASGGTKAFEFTWTPVLDGFKKTVADLPDIPPRVVSKIEAQIDADVTRLKGNFSTGLDTAINDALANLEPPEEIKLKSATAEKAGAEGVDSGASSQNERSSFVVDSLNKGSAEALKAIFSNQNKTPEKQLSETKKTNGLLSSLPDKIASALPSAPVVQGAV